MLTYTAAEQWSHDTGGYIPTHLFLYLAQEDRSVFFLFEFDSNQLFLLRQRNLNESLTRVFYLSIMRQLVFLLHYKHHVIH